MGDSHGNVVRGPSRRHGGRGRAVGRMSRVMAGKASLPASAAKVEKWISEKATEFLDRNVI